MTKEGGATELLVLPDSFAPLGLGCRPYQIPRACARRYDYAAAPRRKSL